MKHPLLMLPLLLLGSLFVRAQSSYYDFYYTNLPPEKITEYAQAFRTAFDQIYLPSYSDSCRQCTPLCSTVAAALPILRSELRRYLPGDLYFKNQVPGSFYHIVGNKTLPYIIRTLYWLDGNRAEAIYQVKVTFSAQRPKQIAAMEVYAPQSGKHFSRAMVYASYRLMVEEPRKLAQGNRK